jgi:hypothetical protein
MEGAVAKPWDDSIKASKSLTIFAGPSIPGSVWAGVFTNAIAEFNRLSSANTLGVTFTASTTAPDPNNSGGANVQFEVANGKIGFVSFGTPFSLQVIGTSLFGDTKQVSVKYGDSGPERMIRAFIVLPATPQINASPVRGVGDGVKLLMAVHEMVHACGLTNADHCPDDLFNGSPQPRAGSTPADDKIEVNGPKLLPPLFLAPKTIAAIQNNWK